MTAYDICANSAHDPVCESLWTLTTSMPTARLEKLTNANRSVSSVNDRLFPVELTEIADWTSTSQYMLHSNFGQELTMVIGGNFGAYNFIMPLSLFPQYLSTFFGCFINGKNTSTKLK